MPKSETQGSRGGLAKILPFGKRGTRKESSDRVVAPIGPEGCKAFLSHFAPVSDELAALFKPPKELRIIDANSLSSQTYRTAAKASAALACGGKVTEDMLRELPDYGVQISQRGGSVFCLFVDKSRRIMVWDSLGNGLGGDLSWRFFADTLRKTIDEAEARTGRKEAFKLVFNKESSISVF